MIFCKRCKQLDCRCAPMGDSQSPMANGIAAQPRFVRVTAAERAAWRARLTPVELLFEHRRVVAALSPKALSLAQLRVLYGMLPPEAFFQPDLAGRWEVAVVLAPPDWAAAQRARVPMLPPKGEKVCFV
jgi:hypothetical protein